MQASTFFRPWRTLLILAALLSGIPQAQADPAGLVAALNRSGQQRMLSQRIVKAYSQLGLGRMPEAAAAQLASALKTYEANLDWLQRAAPDQFSAELVGSLRLQWQPFRIVAAAPPTRAGAAMLLLRSERLLQAAENLTSYYEVSLYTDLSHLINLSGRQRMLSQRLAMFHLLQAWGFEAALAWEEIDVVHQEFYAALGELMAARENTPEIAAALEAVRLEWEWLRAAPTLESVDASRFAVLDGCEALLSHMEHITALYESLAMQR